jgi:hypothetical protein
MLFFLHEVDACTNKTFDALGLNVDRQDAALPTKGEPLSSSTEIDLRVLA